MLLSLSKKFIHHYGISYSSSLLGFLIVIICARILGVEQFAWFAAGVAFGGFIIPLTTLGSDYTFVRDAARISEIKKIGEMAFHSFSMRLTSITFIAILLLIFAPFYTGTVNDGLGVSFVAIWAGLQGLYPASWYDYLGRTREQNTIVFGERLASLFLICVLWILPSPFYQTIFLGLALLFSRLIFIIIQISQWIKISNAGKFRLNFKIPKTGDGINIKVTTASISNAILVYGNQLFLRDNKLELAAYGLAFQIMGLIFIYQGQAQRLLSRSIVNLSVKKSTASESLTKSISIIAGGSAVLSAAAWSFIEVLPWVLNDPRYALMSKFTPLLCIWVAISGAGVAVTQHLLAIHLESYYLKTAITSGIIALIIGALTIPRFGAIAVIATLLCVHTIAIVLNATKYKKIVSGFL